MFSSRVALRTCAGRSISPATQREGSLLEQAGTTRSMRLQLLSFTLKCLLQQRQIVKELDSAVYSCSIEHAAQTDETAQTAPAGCNVKQCCLCRHAGSEPAVVSVSLLKSHLMICKLSFAC